MSQFKLRFSIICPTYDNLKAYLLSAVNADLLDPNIKFSTIMSSENDMYV